MKHFFVFYLVLFTSFFALSQNWVDIKGSNTNDNIQLLSATETEIILEFGLSGFWYTEVETSKGSAWLIKSKNGASSLKQGAPDLPVYATSVVIPGNSKMSVEIISSEYEEIRDVLIAPSKGNLLRTVNPSDVDYEYGKYYTNNAYYHNKISNLRDPYIVRDLRGQTVLINPMQYNPVTKVLRIYSNIKLRVYEDGVSNINTLEYNHKISSVFNEIYKHHFINFNQNSRYTPVEEEGNLLIISYPDFIDEIEPYANWKTISGTHTEVVDVTSIGGASDIKQFIADYYNDNGLTYVLLVGDAPQVPSSTIGGVDSDVDYSYVVGDDHYPDLFVGRFSAETEAHVTTQVQRVLDYEQTPITDTAWYTKAIGIASAEGTGDDGEYDYEHMRNIGDNKLVPFTYNFAYEFFDGSQGGNDATGNPTPNMIADAVNSGATIINYTGHGSTVSWGTSGFSNNNISNLTNTGKLPFIFSVACVNGNFVNSYCFAEAWLRAEHNGSPSGAIATLMSTINQSWAPPMRGQDEMNDILTEAYSDNIKRTFGGISMNGCMNMNDVYGSNGDDMTDTWTIFGDPSLEIRTAVPQDLAVTHSPSVFLGESSFTVNCNFDGAFATLSLNGEILGSSTIENGLTVITFDPLSSLGTADIVVTAFNHIPYISTVEIVPAAGPFVTYATNTINDSAGNNNGLMDYSESILLTVGLVNSGVDDAIGVTATISTTSEYVEIITNQAYYGNINSGDTASVLDAFSLLVSNDIPDEIIANFTITAVDESGSNQWQSGFMLTGHSPNLIYNSFTIDDSNGNGNGKFEPGETADIVINVVNNGSADAYNVISSLMTESEYVTINSDPQIIGDMISSQDYSVVYNVSAHGDTPDGTSAFFNFDMIGDYEISGTGNFFTIIGKKPILVLNLANSISSDSMDACFNELQVGRDILTNWPDELDTYRSVFILLGTYPNNYTVTTSQGERLAQYLQNGGRAYMEGADAWAFDDQTSGHDMFNINGITDGVGDLQSIIGESGSIMEGFSQVFDGSNNYIDHIEPKEDALLIFSNSNPEYGTGVSFENDTYKTIGTSFEFGGLIDNDASTKDGIMAEILYFFDIDYTWTDIEDKMENHKNITAYPNPSSGDITFEIYLSSSEEVTLWLTDINGRVVNDIGTNQKLSAGIHKLKLNADNVKPGLYFYNIIIGSKLETGKFIISK